MDFEGQNRRGDDARQIRVEDKIDKVLENTINNKNKIDNVGIDLKEHKSNDKKAYVIGCFIIFFILTIHTTEVIAFVGKILGVD